MRIAIYSLTRDRFDYTQACFASLRKNAGIEFDHFVVDNGSKDGTAEWIENECQAGRITSHVLLAQNVGISKASNIALETIAHFGDYDYIGKFDNDCLVKSENTLRELASVISIIQNTTNKKWLLSPRVEGINRQPHRAWSFGTKDHTVGGTAIVGGLFHFTLGSLYMEYRYPENLPLAWGQDDDFCKWMRDKGHQVGYVEDLVVEHYRGTDQQAKDHPEYFERKWREEKSAPTS